MQIRHVKNLYWLVLVIALIFALSFSSNPFFFWTGLITALFALISILVGKPALMWLFWTYVIIVNLPFAIPFLLLAGIAFLFGKEIAKSIYKWVAPAVAIVELIFAVKLLGGAGWFFIGTVIYCPFLIYAAFFENDQQEKPAPTTGTE